MTEEQNYDNTRQSRKFTRRRFIQLAATGLLAAGCTPVQELATPTTAPTAVPTTAPTVAPTATPLPTTIPTATTTPPIKPDIIQMYPDVPSKVVHTRHAGVWQDEGLDSTAIRQMLDASITELTGLNDAREAWAALFDSRDRIAIKVNTIRLSAFWTHVPLVMVVTECLQEVGIAPEQVVIFDRLTSEMERAGFPINQDGAGMRCHGTDFKYVEGWTLMDKEIGLSEILTDCTALVNMPILKENLNGGITFAMKNHYGVFDKPQEFHAPQIEQAIAELNALEPIQERTRLIIGDALEIAQGTAQGWAVARTGDSIFVSFDPVAHDTAGLQLLSEVWTADGDDPTMAIELATPWLENGAKLGLGTNKSENMELIEIALG